ncbi:hypothetical protein [Mucilaginibacter phyllosphaerae]|uniref:Uncharacterized protein n=1 Tax=Mucilaginibacter phyllosphaerae TaxID=1812349 RepID=A0A4Y8AL92_9SPHI|nr:hypothetical protein [Mucilaginibacter phyllosphaerae]MBB3967733.1 hypothetical protein [Mucilaginibacter phyllosphaerae]TEW69215.1 hypothetical protein E2R65_03340 [Mucilaginibacter phyllosphaerae]GGH03691.1 hypothetical protein GCM10007352_06460 [Mucilaginibacter phyllosphaerae]
MDSQKSSSYSTTKSRRGKFKISIITVCITCVILLGYFNLNYLVIGYYYVVKFDHFNEGDKVYIAETYFKNQNIDALGTMELIRPLKKEDLDTLGYTFGEKLKISPQLNDTLKPYLKYLGPSFDIYKMRQFKSGLIGTFKGYKIRYVKDISGKYYVRAVYALINPDKRIFNKDYLAVYPPPANYILADSDIYVMPLDISKNELSNFKKK